MALEVVDPVLIPGLLLGLGLLMGSFYGALVHRVPRRESIVSPPSACPKCKRRLGVPDLVPVFSWVFLRGRCRHCRAPISVRYPLIELVTGLGFASVYLVHPEFPSVIAWLVFFSLMLLLFIIDLEHMILPDRLTLPGIALGITATLLGWTDLAFVQSVGGAIFGYGLIFVVAKLSRGGMGMGDAKLLAMVGTLLGPWGVAYTLFGASLLGSLVGVGLILAGRHKRKAPMPFGPFLAVAAWIVWVLVVQ